MLRLVGLRHEHLHILADQLRRVVAKQAFGRRVDALDQPAVVDGDDGGDRGFQNAPQLGSLGFGGRRLGGVAPCALPSCRSQ